MNYEKFPFGKYKGHLLSDLPNTYIVYALETFDLPDDLVGQLQSTLMENLGMDYQDGVPLVKLNQIYNQMMTDVFCNDAGWGKESRDAITHFWEHLLEASR